MKPLVDGGGDGPLWVTGLPSAVGTGTQRFHHKGWQVLTGARLSDGLPGRLGQQAMYPPSARYNGIDNTPERVYSVISLN